MSLNGIALTLFFVFYLILPEYFALEVSSALPLLTASRCIIVLLFICLIKKKIINVRIDKSYKTYFCVMFVVFLYHLVPNSSEAAKALFSLVAEELLLYVVLINLITSKEQLLKGICLIVKVSGLVSILGICEAVSGTNVFYILTTTSRDMLQASYDRLGILRAEAGFGHPVYFAVYLVSILPFSLYFYESTNKITYLFVVILNIIALFSTGSRGGIGVLAVLLLYIIFKKRKAVRRKYMRFFGVMIPLLIIIFLVFPEILKYITNLVSSLLNTLGLTNVNINSFGRNSSGIESRLAQFSGLLWAKEHNVLLMGFGPGAHKHGLISYTNILSGNWNVVNSIDIGYVGYILLYGIVGTIGYAVLYISSIKKAWRYSNEDDSKNIFNAFKLFYIAYFISLTNSVGLNNLFFVITFLMNICINFEKRETMNEKKI